MKTKSGKYYLYSGIYGNDLKKSPLPISWFVSEYGKNIKNNRHIMYRIL